VRERELYAGNLRHLLDGLATRFPRAANGSSVFDWTVPAGGFFVVLTVPFLVDNALLERSARDYGVLWTPMHHFYDDSVAVQALRLSCSAVTAEQIDVGLDRLAALLNDQLSPR
jgi:(S)-3,5-dihydroxyphenylglycine transaminase